MIRRRDVLTLLGGVAVAWPIAAAAQGAAQPKLVGILFPTGQQVEQPNLIALRERLAELGYVEGRDYRLTVRYGSLTDRDVALRDGAALLALDPAVIVTGANNAALAMHQLTASVPIVFASVTDPVELGFAKSFAHPEGNMTGIVLSSNPAIVGKEMALLKELAPAVKRIDVFHDPLDPASRQFSADAAQKLDLTVRFFPIAHKEELVSALESTVDTPDAYLFSSNPFLNTMRKELAALVATTHRPAIYANRATVDAGGLISYGVSIPGLFRTAADYIAKILGGAAPRDLPIQQPALYDLVINLKTAKALGLTIPPKLLARADEVIE